MDNKTYDRIKEGFKQFFLGFGITLGAVGLVKGLSESGALDGATPFNVGPKITQGISNALGSRSHASSGLESNMQDLKSSTKSMLADNSRSISSGREAFSRVPQVSKSLSNPLSKS